MVSASTCSGDTGNGRPLRAARARTDGLMMTLLSDPDDRLCLVAARRLTTGKPASSRRGSCARCVLTSPPRSSDPERWLSSNEDEKTFLRLLNPVTGPPTYGSSESEGPENGCASSESNLKVEWPLIGGLQRGTGRGGSSRWRFRPKIRRTPPFRLPGRSSTNLAKNLKIRLLLLRMRLPLRFSRCWLAFLCCCCCSESSVPGQLGTPSGVRARLGGAYGGAIGSGAVRCGSWSEGPEDRCCEMLVLEYW